MTILLIILGVYGTALGRTVISAIAPRRRDLPVIALAWFGLCGVTPAAVEDAVAMVEGCSGVCVDPDGLVLTARHCDLPATVTVRFKDRTVSATRVWTCREVEGPVVYDCTGEGFPYLPVAATAPQVGERVWSYGYPHLDGERQLSWASGPLLHWSTFEYAGGAFNGNVVRCVTAPGWSGGPLLNAKAEVCGLLNSTDGETSVFIASAAVREASAAVRASRTPESPPATSRPTLMVFGSSTCGPCRQFREDYTQHSEFRRSLDAAFTVEWVDVDERPDVVQRYGITEVPTFVVAGRLRCTGYEGPDQLLAALGLDAELVARPPPQREVVADAAPVSQSSSAPVTDTAANPTAPAVSPPSSPAVPHDDRLDRLTGLVQTAVSIATWLGVGGATGGAGGLILGGLALWRTLRQRRAAKAARDPPSVARPAPVITVEAPPPPQAIVPETRFAPYERDTFAEAFAWAEAELVRKYPGAVSTLEALKGLIQQFLSAKGLKK